MTLYLRVWHSHCTWSRFTVLVSCNDELAVYAYPLFFACRGRLQNLRADFRTVGLYYITKHGKNLQRFTSSCGSKHFAACDCWTQASWQVM